MKPKHVTDHAIRQFRIRTNYSVGHLSDDAIREILVEMWNNGQPYEPGEYVTQAQRYGAVPAEHRVNGVWTMTRLKDRRQKLVTVYRQTRQIRVMAYCLEAKWRNEPTDAQVQNFASQLRGGAE